MQKTAIAWSQMTWNPIRGCKEVSPGCLNCYAAAITVQKSRKDAIVIPAAQVDPFIGYAHMKDGHSRWTGKMGEMSHKLSEVGSITKPSIVFVNSMSDLFWEKVRVEYIAEIVASMALADHCVFQVLTKRAERMRAILDHKNFPALVQSAIGAIACGTAVGSPRDNFSRPKRLGYSKPFVKKAARTKEIVWPLPNVWWGVSVEDKARLKRVDELMATQSCAIRWVSYEPALEDVSFADYLSLRCQICHVWFNTKNDCRCGKTQWDPSLHKLDWIVCGGESDQMSFLARPFNLRWARARVKECDDAGVPIFMKQLGSWPHNEPDGWALPPIPHYMPQAKERCQTRRQTPYIDFKDRSGADPAEWPRDLRRQEMPVWAMPAAMTDAMAETMLPGLGV